MKKLEKLNSKTCIIAKKTLNNSINEISFIIIKVPTIILYFLKLIKSKKVFSNLHQPQTELSALKVVNLI